jgi:hypothetical protein
LNASKWPHRRSKRASVSSTTQTALPLGKVRGAVPGKSIGVGRGAPSNVGRFQSRTRSLAFSLSLALPLSLPPSLSPLCLKLCIFSALKCVRVCKRVPVWAVCLGVCVCAEAGGLHADSFVCAFQNHKCRSENGCRKKICGIQLATNLLPRGSLPVADLSLARSLPPSLPPLSLSCPGVVRHESASLPLS